MLKFFIIICLIISSILTLLLYGAKNLNQNRIDNSPNFIDGKAKNYAETPLMVEGEGDFSYFELFSKKNMPEKPIPTVKTDLKALNKSDELMVWLGHSSIMVQTSGKRILVDPLLSEAGSPVPFINKPFEGTKLYEADDIPEIDYLIITHNHYDHLSKKTIKAIEGKVKIVICPLGVGKFMKKWGYPEEKIVELDWNEEYSPEDGYTIYCLTARHFSGRSINDKDQTLWAAFLLQTPERKIYFSGDSGYGEHFKETGERFGGVDLAFMENGQYDPRWKFIHMAPDETMKASADLNTKFMMPIHNSKFKISRHQWNAPLITLAKLKNDYNFLLMTPLIGEAVPLWNENQQYTNWWE